MKTYRYLTLVTIFGLTTAIAQISAAESTPLDELTQSYYRCFEAVNSKNDRRMVFAERDKSQDSVGPRRQNIVVIPEIDDQGKLLAFRIVDSLGNRFFVNLKKIQAFKETPKDLDYKIALQIPGYLPVYLDYVQDKKGGEEYFNDKVALPLADQLTFESPDHQVQANDKDMQDVSYSQYPQVDVTQVKGFHSIKKIISSLIQRNLRELDILDFDPRSKDIKAKCPLKADSDLNRVFQERDKPK